MTTALTLKLAFISLMALCAHEINIENEIKLKINSLKKLFAKLH